MSEVVADKVVQMEFDNVQFEKDIKQTLDSLQQLNDKVDKLSSNSGNQILKGMHRNLKIFNLQALKSNTILQEMNKRFSVLGTSGGRFVEKITDRLENMAWQAAKTLTGINSISDGFTKYGQKTGAVATLMTATGNDIDTVSKALDNLNWFTDETSYNFIDMVNTMSKFSASGEKDLGKLTQTVEGIALWGAKAGQNSQTVSRAMYQLSQAVGRGYIGYQDWLQAAVNTNMATSEMKNLLIEAGGKDAEAAIKKTGDFNSSLKEGWLTIDRFNTVMQKYTQGIDSGNYKNGEFIKSSTGAADSTTKFSEQAFRAAQECRTWADVVDALKDAIGTGWSKTFELIFGDANEVRPLFTGIANMLIEVADKFTSFRNDLLSGWRELKTTINGEELTGRDVLLQSFVNILNAISTAIWPIKTAFEEVFGIATPDSLMDATKGIEGFTRSLILSVDKMLDVEQNLEYVFGNIKKAIETLLAYRKPILTFFLALTVIKSIKSIFANGLGLGTVFTLLKAIIAFSLLKKITGLSNVTLNLEGIVKIVTTAVTELKDKIVTLFGVVTKSKAFKIFTNILKVLAGAIVLVIAGIATLISKIVAGVKMIPFAKIGNGIKSVWNITKGFFSFLASKVKGLKIPAPNFSGFINGFKNIKAQSSSTGDFIKKIFIIAGAAIVATAKTVWNYLKQFFTWIGSKLSGTKLPKIDLTPLKNEIESLKERSTGVIDFIKNAVMDLIGWIGSKLSGANFGSGFASIIPKNLASALTGANQNAKGSAAGSNMFSGIGKAAEGATEKVKTFVSTVKNLLGGGKKTGAEEVSESFKNADGDIEETTSHVVDNTVYMASAVNSEMYTMTKTANGNADAIKGIGSAIHGFFTNMEAGLESADKDYPILMGFVKFLTKIDWQKVFGVVWLLFFIHYIKQLRKSVEKVGGAITTVGNNITNQFTSIADAFKNMATSIAGTVSTVGGSISMWFKSMTNINKAKMFKDIAIGIGLITASLIALAVIPLDPDKLIGASVAILTITAALGGFVNVITKSAASLGEGGSKNLTLLIGSLVVFGALVAELSVVLAVTTAVTEHMIKTSSSFSEAIMRMAAPVATVSFIIGAIVFALAKLAAFAPMMNATSTALLKLAGSIAAISGSIFLAEIAVQSLLINIVLLYKEFQMMYMAFINGAVKAEMSGEGLLYFGKACAAVLVGLGVVIGSIKLLGFASKAISKNAGKAAIGITALSVSLLFMSKVIEKLGAMDYKKMWQGFGGMALSLAVLVAAMEVLFKLGRKGSKGPAYMTSVAKSMSRLAGAMLKMSASVLLLSVAIQILGRTDPLVLAKGLAVVAGMFLSFALAMKIMNKADVGKVAAAILALSVSIYILIPALTILGVLFPVVIRGLIIVAGLVLSIGAAVKLMSGAKMGNIIGIMATMVIAVGLLAETCKRLVEIGDIDSVMKSAGSIAGMILAIGLAVKMMGKVMNSFGKGKAAAAKMTGLVATIGTFGAVMSMLGEVLVEMSQYDWKSVAAATVGMSVAMIAFGRAVSIITKSLSGFKSITQVKNYVKAMVPTIVALGAAMAAIGLVIGSIAQNENWASITAACVGMGAAMVAFAAAAAILANAFTGIKNYNWPAMLVTVGAMAGVTAILGLVVKSIASLDASVDQMYATLTTLSVAMGVFSGCVAVLALVSNVMNSINALAMSVMMVALAGSIAILAVSMKSLENINTSKIAATIAVFTAAVAALSLLSLIPGVAVGAIAMGAAAALMATGIGLLSFALNALLPTLDTFIQDMEDIDAKKISRVGDSLATLAKGAVALGGALIVTAAGMGLSALAAGPFAEGITAIGTAIYGVLGLVNEATSWGNDLINNFIGGMMSGIGDLGATASNAAYAVWYQMHQSTGEVGSWLYNVPQWGSDLILNFISGMISQFSNLKGTSDQASKMVHDAMAPSPEEAKQNANEIYLAYKTARDNLNNYINSQNSNGGLWDHDFQLRKLQKQLRDVQAEVQSVGGTFDEQGNIITAAGNKVEYGVQTAADGVTYYVKKADGVVSKDVGNTAEDVADAAEDAGSDIEGTVKTTGEHSKTLSLAAISDILEGVKNGTITIPEAFGEIAQEGGQWFLEKLDGLGIGTDALQNIIDGADSQGGVFQAIMGAIGLDGGTALGQQAIAGARPYLKSLLSVLSIANDATKSIAQREAAGHQAEATLRVAGVDSQKELNRLSGAIAALNAVSRGDFEGGSTPPGGGGGSVPSGKGSDDKKKKGSGSGSKQTKDATKALAEYYQMVQKFNNRAIPVVNMFASSFGNVLGQMTDKTPFQAAGAGFEMLLQKIYEAGGGLDETFEDSEEKGTAAQQRANAIRKAYVEAFDKISEAIDGSLDFFTEFDKKTSDMVKPEKLLKNAQSQVNGLSKSLEMLTHLAVRGVPDDILEELGSNPLENYEKIAQMASMNQEQLQQFIGYAKNAKAYSNEAAAAVMNARVIANGLEELTQNSTQSYEDLDDITKAYVNYMMSVKENNPSEEYLKVIVDYAEQAGMSVEDLQKHFEATVDVSNLAAQATLSNLQQLYAEVDAGQAKLEEYKQSAKDWADSFAETLSGFGSAFGDVSTEAATKPEKLLANLEGNLKNLKSTMFGVLELQERGFNQDAIKDLMDQGLPAINGARQMNEAQIKQLNDSYKEFADLEKITDQEKTFMQQRYIRSEQKNNKDFQTTVKTIKTSQQKIREIATNWKDIYGNISAEDAAKEAQGVVTDAADHITAKYEKTAKEVQTQTAEMSKAGANAIIEDTFKMMTIPETAKDDLDAVVTYSSESLDKFNDEFLMQAILLNDSIEKTGTTSDATAEAFNALVEAAVKYGYTGEDINTTLMHLNETQETFTDRIAENFDTVYKKCLESRNAVQDFENAAVEVGQALHDSLSNVDVFAEIKEQDPDEELLGSDLLKRLKGNVDQMRKTAEEYFELESRGVSKDLLEKLSAEGAEYIHAAMTWSTTDIQNANQMYQDSLDIPDEAQKAAEQKWKETGRMNGKTYAETVAQYASDVTVLTEVATQMTTNWKSVMDPQMINMAIDAVNLFGKSALEYVTGETAEQMQASITTATQQAVSTGLSDGVSQGVDAAKTDVSDSADDAAKKVTGTVADEINPENAKDQADKYTTALTDALNAKQQDMYNAGVNLMQGLINGLGSMEETLQAKANEIAAITATAITTYNKIHSPSRLMYTLGQYIDQGFVNGLEDGKDQVEASSNALASMVGTAFGLMSDTDLNSQPTITPVVDYSNVASSSSAIAAMLGQKAYGINLDAGISGVTTPKDATTAKLNSLLGSLNNKDVVSAIISMRGDIASLGTAISNMQIVMDTGTVAGAVTNGVSTNINNEVGRKQAVWL